MKIIPYDFDKHPFSVTLKKGDLKFLMNISDSCGCDMQTYVREAINNYAAYRIAIEMLSAEDGIFMDEVIVEAAKQELPYYQEYFEKAGVTISYPVLLDLIIEKIKMTIKG